MSLAVRIVTPTGILFDGPADEAVIPGLEGALGIRHGHRRLITALKAGKVRVKQGGTEKAFEISGGFADIGPDGAVIAAR